MGALLLQIATLGNMGVLEGIRASSAGLRIDFDDRECDVIKQSGRRRSEPEKQFLLDAETFKSQFAQDLAVKGAARVFNRYGRGWPAAMFLVLVSCLCFLVRKGPHECSKWKGSIN